MFDIWRKWLFIFLGIAMAMLPAAVVGCVLGSGNSANQERDGADFGVVIMDAGATLHLSSVGLEKIIISGEDNIIPLIETAVSGGTLFVSPKTDICPKLPVEIRAGSGRIEAIRLDGSGRIIAESLPGDNHHIVLNGSGNIDLGCAADSLELVLNGSGRILATGRAEFLSAEMNGMGSIIARELECETAIAKINGAGDISLTVVDSLRAAVRGSGSVDYSGNPAHIIKEISGSGSVLIAK